MGGLNALGIQQTIGQHIPGHMTVDGQQIPVVGGLPVGQVGTGGLYGHSIQVIEIQSVG